VDWGDIYGAAVLNLDLAPSEVRKMTIGEINAVVRAKVKAEDGASGNLSESNLKELYDDLQAAKNG